MISDIFLLLKLKPTLKIEKFLFINKRNKENNLMLIK